MSDTPSSPDLNPSKDERQDAAETGIHSMSSRDTNTVSPLAFADWAALERARLTDWNQLNPLQKMEHYRKYPGTRPTEEELQALIDRDDYDVELVDDTNLPSNPDNIIIEAPPFRPLV